MANVWWQNMLQGYTVVPNILWQYFAQLGLTGDQFTIITYLISKSQNTTSLQELVDVLGWDMAHVMEVCDELVNQNYLDIDLKLNADGKQGEDLSLVPLFERIEDYFFNQEQASSLETLPHVNVQNLGPLFEKEFGRPLTPLEFQKLNQWVIDDGYDLQLIHKALTEAVIQDIKNVNYIDKILINWEKRNIKTQDEVVRLLQKQSPISSKARPNLHIPLHEWQDGE